MRPRWLIMVCAALCGVTLAFGAAQPGVPLDPLPVAPDTSALPENSSILHAGLAPDGATLALLVAQAGAPTEVYLASADQPGAAAALGPSTHNATSCEWSFGADRVVVALPGEASGSSTLRAVPTRPGAGAPIDLTPPADRATLVALSPRRPNEALVSIASPPGAPPDAWIVDLTTGERRLALRAPMLDDASVIGYIANRDLAVRLLVTRSATGAVALRRPAPFIFGAEPLPVIVEWTSQQAGASRVLGFDPTERLVHALDARAGVAELVAIDLASGVAAPLVSAGASVRDVLRSPEGVCLGVWTDDSSAPFIAIERGIEPDMQALRAFMGGRMRIVDQSADAQRWLVAYDAGEAGALQWVLYDRASRRPRMIE